MGLEEKQDWHEQARTIRDQSPHQLQELGGSDTSFMCFILSL